MKVPAGPGLPDGLSIPESDLVERFSRSSGPGGQSVNTTDSRVELEYDVRAASTLTAAQRARVLRRWPSGVIDEDAFRRTVDAGVPMVMDTCPAIEWRRRG